MTKKNIDKNVTKMISAAYELFFDKDLGKHMSEVAELSHHTWSAHIDQKKKAFIVSLVAQCLDEVALDNNTEELLCKSKTYSIN